MNIFIYKLTSPNNKIYIGQTRYPKKRFAIYKCLKCISQSKLYNSIKKYKWENFNIEIIAEVPEQNADFYERVYIKYYNSVDTGLNCETGGIVNKIISEETRNKLRIASTGRHHTEETKEKLRISNKNQMPWSKGGHLSETHKKRISEALRGKKKTKEHITKISIKLKGKTAWNKGKKTGPLSNEHKEKIRLGNINYRKVHAA